MLDPTHHHHHHPQRLAIPSKDHMTFNLFLLHHLGHKGWKNSISASTTSPGSGQSRIGKERKRFKKENDVRRISNKTMIKKN